MNANVLLGSITFILWSTFSTWYYVNHVKELDPPVVAVPAEVIEVAPAQPIDNVSQVAEIGEPEVETLAPISIEEEFVFYRNTTNPINQQRLDSFLTSLRDQIGDRKVIIMITGHTCDLGSESFNLDLSQKRIDYLRAKLSIDQTNIVSIDDKAVGEKEPKYPNTSEKNRLKNRRVAITINSQP